MRHQFVHDTLQRLLADGVLSRDDRVLAVCAASSERDVFLALGFRDVTISNLSETRLEGDVAPYAWSRQDAQHLTFESETFDVTFVSDGLHHCSSPHKALLEMYRVARKGVVVFESRDNALVRLAQRVGLAQTYELLAVSGNGYVAGGVDNTSVPNFIYRWTEEEFRKTILSYNPKGPHRFRFFHGVNIQYGEPRSLRSIFLHLATPFIRAFGKLLKRQANSFAMVALRPMEGELWPWLEQSSSGVRFKRDVAIEKSRAD